jgi:hypothetical protein
VTYLNGLLMSFENNDSESVRSSASVAGPFPTVDCVVCTGLCGTLGVDGDCGKKLWGFGVGPSAGDPGGFPHALGGVAACGDAGVDGFDEEEAAPGA